MIYLTWKIKWKHCGQAHFYQIYVNPLHLIDYAIVLENNLWLWFFFNVMTRIHSFCIQISVEVLVKYPFVTFFIMFNILKNILFKNEIYLTNTTLAITIEVLKLKHFIDIHLLWLFPNLLVECFLQSIMYK